MKYSQNNEEQFILNYFGDFKGNFIDIGANDGTTLSNTRALFEKGWQGVLVEPSPNAFKKLRELYKDVKGIYPYNFAIGTHNGRMKLYESGTHFNKGDVGLLSTSNEEEKSRWGNTTTFEETEVVCYRWKTFLNRLKIKKFDFISIDAEGMDLQILEQINLTDTKCLCIEWNSKADLKESYDRLTVGFRTIYTSAENIVYAR